MVNNERLKVEFLMKAASHNLLIFHFKSSNIFLQHHITKSLLQKIKLQTFKSLGKNIRAAHVSNTLLKDDVLFFSYHMAL